MARLWIEEMFPPCRPRRGAARSARSAPIRGAGELAYAGATSIEAGNRYVREVNLPAFNAEFARPARGRFGVRPMRRLGCAGAGRTMKMVFDVNVY